MHINQATQSNGGWRNCHFDGACGHRTAQITVFVLGILFGGAAGAAYYFNLGTLYTFAFSAVAIGFIGGGIGSFITECVMSKLCPQKRGAMASSQEEVSPNSTQINEEQGFSEQLYEELLELGEFNDIPQKMPNLAEDDGLHLNNVILEFAEGINKFLSKGDRSEYTSENFRFHWLEQDVIRFEHIKSEYTTLSYKDFWGERSVPIGCLSNLLRGF